LTDEYDTGVLLLTLQGLINRHPDTLTPLFLNTVGVFSQFPRADAHWVHYLETTKNVTFANYTASGVSGLLAAILDASDGRIGGVVLYDAVAPEPDATRYIALNLCGLESLLPVTPALRRAYPRLAALPVRHDLRKRWATNGAAYAFALSSLMPRANRSVGWSAGRTHRDDAGWEVWQGGPPEMALLGLDIAIARSGFIFNLTPNATACDVPRSGFIFNLTRRARGAPDSSATSRRIHLQPHSATATATCRGSPQEASLFDAIMEGLNTTVAGSLPSLPAIYGWSEPESEYTQRVSRGGGYVLCSEAPNLSFWAFFAIAPGALHNAFGRAARAAAAARPPPPLDTKTYVVFQTNEGDTPKIVAGLFGGSWLNPKRGAVAIAWGINLLLCREFPALMEYFAASASANDTFFAGTSGAGYVYPSIMPAAAFTRYAQQVERVSAMYSAPPATGAPADWGVDIWNWGVPEGTLGGEWARMIAEYARVAPAVGAFSQQAIGVNATTLCVPIPAAAAAARAFVPVSFAARSLWYPGSPSAPWSRSGQTRAGALDDLERRIRATERRGVTTFSIVYGLVDGNSGPEGLDAIDAALAMAARLPRERFDIVGAQEFARLSVLHCARST
jgi:hypothetical protein